MKIRLHRPVAIAIAALTFAGLACANNNYTTTLLSGDALGRTAQAFGINKAGQVVGEAWTCNLPFGTGCALTATIWNGATATYLGHYGVGRSQAFALNDFGQVVGHDGWSTPPRAAIWNGTSRTYLGPQFAESYALGINEVGQVVGTYNGRAILWNGTTATVLANLGFEDARANDINNAGEIVGYSTVLAGTFTRHATLWSGTTVTDLGTLGGSWSGAASINEAGQVAGHSSLAGDGSVHATIWRDAVATDLGALGRTFSYAFGINNSSQVVGTAFNGWLANGSTDGRAILWNGNVATDLNSYLDSNLAAAGWVLESANGINDSGSVVGRALNTLSGEGRGFILTPVPEPQTYALMLAGLGLIAGVARRRSMQQ